MSCTIVVTCINTVQRQVLVTVNKKWKQKQHSISELKFDYLAANLLPLLPFFLPFWSRMLSTVEYLFIQMHFYRNINIYYALYFVPFFFTSSLMLKISCVDATVFAEH